MNVFPDQSGGYPGTNFGNQCGAQTYKNPSGSSSPLLSNCPNIGPDIKTCQSLGKKVLLSLRGAIPNNQHVNSDTTAVNFANLLWRAFGPDKESTTSTFPRPFGNAVVDGFDFDIENVLASRENSGDLSRGYGKMITTLRDLYTSDKSKSYYISGAPQCIVPDTHLANAIETSWFDFLFVQFYNTPSCSARAYFDHSHGGTNTNISFDKWISFVKASSFNKNVKVYMGLPASNSNQVVYDPKMYLVPSEANTIIKAFQCKYPSSFGGIMVFEATYSEMNSINGKAYVDVLKGYLKGTGCATAPKMIKREAIVAEPTFPTALPTFPITGLAPNGGVVYPPGATTDTGSASTTASACDSSTSAYSSAVCGTLGIFTGATTAVGGAYGVASIQDCEALCLQNDQCKTISYSVDFGSLCDLFGNTAAEGGFEANQYGNPTFERGCFDTGKAPSSCSSTQTSSASPSSTRTATNTKSTGTAPYSMRTGTAPYSMGTGTAPYTRSTGTAPYNTVSASFAYSSGVLPSGISSGVLPSGSTGPYPLSNSSSPASTGRTAPISGQSLLSNSSGESSPTIPSGKKLSPSSTGGEEVIPVTKVITLTSCAPGVTKCPARSHPVVTTVVPITIATFSPKSGASGSPQTTQEVVVTEIVASYVTTCPFAHTSTSSGHRIVETGMTTSTIHSTITSTICIKCVAPPAPAPTAQEAVVTETVTFYTTTCPFTHTATVGGSLVLSTGTTVSTVYSTITSTISPAGSNSPSNIALPGALSHGSANAQNKPSIPGAESPAQGVQAPAGSSPPGINPSSPGLESTAQGTKVPAGSSPAVDSPSTAGTKSPAQGEQAPSGSSPAGNSPSSPNVGSPAQGTQAGSSPAKDSPSSPNVESPAQGTQVPAGSSPAVVETIQSTINLVPVQTMNTVSVPVSPEQTAQPSAPGQSGQTGNKPVVPGQNGPPGSQSIAPGQIAHSGSQPNIPGQIVQSGSSAPFPTNNGTGSASSSGTVSLSQGTESPSPTVAAFTGAASRMGDGAFGLVAVIVAAALML